MSREWCLNPPPNWPVPAKAVIGLDWRPDPAWGPPPVGWQLWRRRRVTGRQPAGRPLVRSLLASSSLGLLVGAVALLGALAGDPAGAPGPAGGAASIGPGSFPAGSIGVTGYVVGSGFGGTGRACRASHPAQRGPGQADQGRVSNRWVAGGVRPIGC